MSAQPLTNEEAVLAVLLSGMFNTIRRNLQDFIFPLLAEAKISSNAEQRRSYFLLCFSPT